MSYFSPRFLDWWQAEAAPSGDSYALKMKALLRSFRIQRHLDKMIAFYKPELDSETALPLVLLYRPANIKEPTSGQQLGPYSVAQFLPSENPEHRVPVVLHEYAHFL